MGDDLFQRYINRRGTDLNETGQNRRYFDAGKMFLIAEGIVHLNRQTQAEV